jgi:hypothetical protein
MRYSRSTSSPSQTARNASASSRSPRSERGSWSGTRADEPARHARVARGRVDQQRRQVDRVDALVAGAALAQQVDPADGLVERPHPERGEPPADLLGHEQEVGGHALRGAPEVGPQVGALGGHAGLAGVPVAGAQHDAALGDHRDRPEAVLVGAQQGGDDHVPTGLEAAVGAHPHPGAQAVLEQGALHLGQAQLPGAAGVLDRRQRAEAPVPPFVAGDLHDVGERLGHAGGDRAHAVLGHQLHRHLAAGLTCLRS